MTYRHLHSDRGKYLEIGNAPRDYNIGKATKTVARKPG